jgi:predicted helicase
MTFDQVLGKYRAVSFSERDKGDRFERLIQSYLLTDPKYANLFETTWLWQDFPFRRDFGSHDIGIDLVAKTKDGNYWAIQCKCFAEDAYIDKAHVDTFLSTSGRSFANDEGERIHFTQRLWVSTTNKWSSKAEETLQHQNPPVTRLNLHELQEAPVDWEKIDTGLFGNNARVAVKELRPHQREALRATIEKFEANDRGKLIMACGTGKTFTSLRIAEEVAGKDGLVLFLVPSIALLGQTLREWTADAKEPINPICICSDSKATKKKIDNDDGGESTVDLALPASTDVKKIVKQFEEIEMLEKSGLTVVFSTYQSIDVIAQTQERLKSVGSRFSTFDIVICDEAHRTTGVTLKDSDESHFVKVHDNNFIDSKKRLYMTATPRLYGEESKSKAEQSSAVLCSMDDEKLYGPEIYRIGFGQAVEQDLLSDYKVLILSLSEDDITPEVQNIIKDESNEISTDDVSKLIGCVNAMSKQILGDNGVLDANDPEPMKRAVAFCQSISSSKKITNTFNAAGSTYIDSLPEAKQKQMVDLQSKHIDGGMSATERDSLMSWLKADTEDNDARVLTNVRCLSEGVDVPSLDAVMFLSARNSQVDVVQSVGRVMRKSPGKKYGYIIIPIVVPTDVEPEKALDDNKRYAVVWTVLNALRAHDDRFNAIVNKIELNKNRPDNVLIGRIDPDGDGDPTNDTQNQKKGLEETTRQAQLRFTELQNVIYARMVSKVGQRTYWEDFAKKVAATAGRQVERISKLVSSEGNHRQAFEDFLQSLRKNINPSITEQQAIEMLSQHIITKPIFSALFEGYSFAESNPVSASLQHVLTKVEADALDSDDRKLLDDFYHMVSNRVQGVDNAEGKQKIIVELYDKFFKVGFPKMVEQLGIVYTPIEVVDFIVHSVNDVLKKEFGRSLSDKNVNILDPFTGTGTFITRLLQSGVIKPEDLERKYKHEIFANEIVLLAYYIAAVNIENTYHDLTGKDSFESFQGIALTDTFQLTENDDSKLFKDALQENTERVERQKNAPLTVILGNPPYSIGQRSENDDSANQSYPKLDSRIVETYAKEATTKSIRSLYDAYVKAFRWSSDRLGKDGGVIAFVSNGSWIDGNSQAGMRKCLEREFSSIYVFNLRGNQRTQGEMSKREGGKVFGSGSRTPISITLLIKNPNKNKTSADIYYHDIGDYLSRADKLRIIKDFKTVLADSVPWSKLTPNEHGDWIALRSSSFENLIAIDPSDTSSFFDFFTMGIATNRDAWVYNSKKSKVESNVVSMLSYYDSILTQKTGKIDWKKISDPEKISWSANLKKYYENGVRLKYKKDSVRVNLYRPFQKQFVYFSKKIIERPRSTAEIFPEGKDNIVIHAMGVGGTKDYSVITSNTFCDFNALEAGAKTFPLYRYEIIDKKQDNLFKTQDQVEYERRDGISDFIWKEAKKRYGANVSKEDIFYYVYGVLHSPDYRREFANDLKKSLPRLPLVKMTDDFWAFSKAGRQLAELHVNYEDVAPYEGAKVFGTQKGEYRVEKMKFIKKDQKDTIIYNEHIKIENIPAKAYEYVVNGRSAIEWIIDRYQVRKDADSGIVNDPNDWSSEVKNPRYILDLLLSVINVSVQTVDIVNALPKLTFEAVVDNE